MTVVRLDEDDLDDEDRAILAEVSKKGYYHGRPKNQAGPLPAKIEAPAPQKLEVGGSAGSRAAFDDFQRKWDRFDDDDYLKKLERETLKASAKASSALPSPQRQPLPALAAEFKVLLVGDTGVGKSALVKSHLTGEFERSSNQTPFMKHLAGEEIQPLRFHTNCGDVGLNIWVVGRKDMELMDQREQLYMQGHAAIVMFDVTSRQSFRSVPNWQRELRQVLGTIPTVLLGNKVDATQRQVTCKQIQSHMTSNKSRKQHLQYYDFSVRDKHNFERPFLWLLRMLTNQPKMEFVAPFAKEPRRPMAPDAAATAARQLHERQLQKALSRAVESEAPL